MDAIPWSQENIALLVELEKYSRVNANRSQKALAQLLEKEHLMVLFYMSAGNHWSLQGQIAFRHYMHLIDRETEFLLQNGGKTMISKFAYHPPNYPTLSDFDNFMLTQY